MSRYDRRAEDVPRGHSGEGNVLDQAIAKIGDGKVRERIAREVELLRSSRRFGLVFDRHLPELVRLPSHPVRKGVQVGLRDESSPDIWTVTRFTDNTRTVAVLDDGTAIETAKLVVVREFGEPVYPGLRSVRRFANGPMHEIWHTVINGENYHVLQVLRTTHRGKIDLLYIDPPYNTGNEDWIYNDRYVDANDRAKSSKWLSFIERRLVTARDLLKPTGIIIVAIGDEEHHRLRMLLDQVFGADNFIANAIWQGSGKNDAKYTAGGVDYMLIYTKDLEALVGFGRVWRESKPGIEQALALGARAWTESSGNTAEATKLYRSFLRKIRSELEPAVFRYDQIDENGRVFQPTDLTSPNLRENLRYTVVHPVTGLPVRTPEKGWRYSRETMDELLQQGRILFGPDETTSPRLKRFLADQDQRVPYPSFVQSRMPGSKHVEGVLGARRFPNPKDHEVLMRWIRLGTPKDAVILDFFGGSGSTTEAVLRLNAEDGGTRQSIVVTNNEVGSKQAKALRKTGHHPGDPEWEAFGVFEYVARPRISTVVTGRRPDGSVYSDGLAANVEMFDLHYLDPGMVRRGKEFAAIAPLLWLEAGAAGERIDTVPESGWALVDNYGVLFDIDTLKSFAEAVTERTKKGRTPKLVFVVTDSLTEFQLAGERLPTGITTVQFFEDYLTNFTINVQGSAR